MLNLKKNCYYAVPFVKYGNRRKDGSYEILVNEFRLGRFARSKNLSCSLHGEQYATVFTFKIKPRFTPSGKMRDGLVEIVIDSGDNIPNEKVLADLFKKIKIVPPEVDEKRFNEIFNKKLEGVENE